MYTLILVVHVIVALFLIFIILIQSSKGEGISDVFGGGSSQTTIFGSRTGTFLTRATTASAIIFMLTCLSLAFVSHGKSRSVMQEELTKKQAADKIQQMLGANKKENKVEPTQAVKNETPVVVEEKAPAAGQQVKVEVQPVVEEKAQAVEQQVKVEGELAQTK